jgi:hypothetical protein
MVGLPIWLKGVRGRNSRGKESKMAKRIRLVEEASSSEVVPKELAAETIWWVDGRVHVEDLKKARISYALWLPQTLSEFNIFFSPPGIRVLGADVPTRLERLGYQVEVVTKEKLKDLHERLRAEQERREREGLGRAEQQRQRMELIHLFAEAHGLKRGSGAWEAFDFFDGKPYSIPYEVQDSGKTGQLYFGRSKETGRLLLVLEYGENCITFADPDTLNAIREAYWRILAKRSDPHIIYFWCLIDSRFCPSDWTEWVLEQKRDLLEGLRRDYVVVARPGLGSGYDLEQARQICEEFGIELRISSKYHDVFRRGELPEDL